MRILILNPNTSESMTAEIAVAARAAAAPGTDSAAASYLSAVGVMDVVAEDGADLICLGCAGMAGVTEAISAKLGVPAVDGVGAAVALAQALVGLGLTTSKVGALAEGPPNPRTYWPISTALGMTP